MGVVDDPVEDGIGDCGLADHVVPARDGQLCSDDGRAPLVAFLEEFKQVEVLLICEAVGAPVVENEELDAGQLVDQLWEAPIEAGHGHILEEPWHADVKNGVIKARGLMAEGTGEPCFSCAGLTGENDLLLCLDPFALRQGENLTAVVEPVHPFECCVFHCLEVAPRAAAVNDLGFEQTVDRLSQGVLRIQIIPRII